MSQIKQGYLYKKSKKTLNKDWKKKYVTLTTDGCLTYHRSLHDYMNEANGKNIPLKHTTVKIPGQKPRCGRSNVTQSPNHLENDAGRLCAFGAALSAISCSHANFVVSVDVRS